MLQSFLRAAALGALLLIGAALPLIAGSTSVWAAEPADGHFEKRLLGTWWARSPHRHEKDVHVYGEVTYTSDGVAKAVMIYHRKDAAGELRAFGRLLMIGRWKVERGVLITSDIMSLPKRPELADQVLRDRIIEIGEDKAVFESLEDGEIFERFRKKPGEGT